MPEKANQLHPLMQVLTLALVSTYDGTCKYLRLTPKELTNKGGNTHQTERLTSRACEVNLSGL